MQRLSQLRFVDTGTDHDALLVGVVGGGTHHTTSVLSSCTEACCSTGPTHVCATINYDTRVNRVANLGPTKNIKQQTPIKQNGAPFINMV